MKRYSLHANGEAYTLKLEDRAAPVPGPGEVCIRVRACSLNYRDLITLEGRTGQPNLKGIVPLSDGAGEVELIGDGVTRFHPGDRVAVNFFRDWQSGPFEMCYHKTALGGSVPGMLAESVVFPEHAVVRVPDHLDFREASTLPCAGVTAWQALVARGGLTAGQSVLCLGTGGVSVFGLQIAKAHGARVIVTSSSDEKLARAAALGADGMVNYQTHPDWDQEILRLTDGQGVDHILEVGGPDTLGKSLASARAGSNVALIGVLTGFGAASTSLFPLVARNANLAGIYVGSRSHFEAFNEFLARNAIHPVIDRIFAFEQAAEAFAHLASGRHFGKIVVDV